MHLFSHGKNGQRHGSRARGPNDDDDERRRATWRPSCILGLQRISFILHIHMMFNWQLSYLEIHWPVSRDHIAASGLELIKVARFLKLTADQVLVFDWIAIVRKLVNANPGLNLFIYANVFAALLCLLIELKTGGQTIYRKAQCKVIKLKSKFYLFLR